MLGAHEWAFRPLDGKALLWLEPWNSDASLALNALDPHFIEICRRVRLVQSPSGEGPIVAWGRISGGTRIAAKQNTGAVDDPWIPVNRRKNTALTIGAGGFHYRKLAEILYGPDYEPPVSLKHLQPDAEWLHCQVLVRGQGKTDGLYERVLPLPVQHRDALCHHDDAKREVLHKLAQDMIANASETKRALRRGLVVFFTGGFAADSAKKPDLDDDRANRWCESLDRRIDDIFFDNFWPLADAIVAAPRDEERFEDAWRTWHEALRDAAEPLFKQALRQMPTPSGRRERARAHARIAFRGALTKALDRLPRSQTRETAA